MELFYPATCFATFIVCAILGIITRPRIDNKLSDGDSKHFRDFQIRYLVAWSICVAADWLQGPYVYALYQEYGYSRADNARLFVCGFGASFLFGTFVAGFADSIGRKRAILLYCFLYSASCLTKHVNIYEILMLGRIAGGVATSILFSAFESWLVSEHTVRNKFPPQLLSYSFSMMYFVTYLVAVFTGLVGNTLVGAVKMTTLPGTEKVHFGGNLIPFDAAIVCMMVGGLYVALTFEENYGESQGAMEQMKGFGKGAVMICTNLKMSMCCFVIALFESSMYIFAFNWTPVLFQGAEAPPFGMIFATFMMGCMVGASIFALSSDFKLAKVLCVAIVFSSFALFLPGHVGMNEMLSRYNFWAFLLFEVCIGIYFPAICTLKSEAVPESHRSTIYNLFRVPMNAIVVGVLLASPDLKTTFKLTYDMLTLAGVILIAQVLLSHWAPSEIDGADWEEKKILLSEPTMSSKDV